MELGIRIAVGTACRWCVSGGGFDLREVAISEHESLYDVPAEFRRKRHTYDCIIVMSAQIMHNYFLI